MRIPIYGQNALGMALSAATLVGCGGAQSVEPNALTSSASTSQSSMSTSQGDLVYLAYGEVSFYTFPGGEYVGTLKGLKDAVALCADTDGNVWVVAAHSHRHSKLLKYAHGGSKPIVSLILENARADACSVDPASGNLAAGTLNSEVAIWANGAAAPTFYSTSGFFKDVRTLSYDGSGNLYMRSFTRSESAAWLPKDGSAVVQFSIDKLGSYGWDGRHFVIGPANGYLKPLTLYKLRGGTGKVTGKVSLKNCAPAYEPPSFSIAGSELAVSCGLDETNSLNYYKYPQGGNPITSFVPGFTGSVAISVAETPASGK